MPTTKDEPVADDAEETADEYELLERPIDQVTPSFFRSIVEGYVDEDRLDGGVARLTVDGDRERRFAIGNDLPEMSDTAYLEATLRELTDVLAAQEDQLDQPVELSIPVADTERVLTEVEDEGTVTVLFQPQGIETLLDQLLADLRDGDVESEAE